MSPEALKVDKAKKYAEGYIQELKCINPISEYFGCDGEIRYIQKQTRYSKIDLKLLNINDPKEIIDFEIKSRNNLYADYPTTMIHVIKVLKMLQDVKQKKIVKAFAVFIFKNNDIYLYEITDKIFLECSFENKPDGRGSFQICLIIPIELLIKI